MSRQTLPNAGRGSAMDKRRALALPDWLIRGLKFAALMVVLGQTQRALINQFPTLALIISVSLLVLFAVIAFACGLIDGRADARTNRNPNARHDFAMTWLLAGLVAGFLSGAVSWLISLVAKGLFVSGLISQITTFAAFCALLVFLPATAAVSIGRWLIDRHAQPADRKGSARADDRVNADVFAKVQHDSAPEPAATATADAELVSDDTR
jgi:hypothetical protein